MGVRRIRDFNTALLGKWCWRLLMERDNLWFRVLLARYGVEGGQLLDGGREASGWWRDIVTLRAEEWFLGNVNLFVGDGKNTLFWSDVWVGGIAFRDRFNRLFELSLLKEESIFGMHSLGWGSEGRAWRWRRRLFVWEEELVGELKFLLQNVTLQVDRVDRRLWRLETSSVYTVRSAYKFLNANVAVDQAVPVSSLWHKNVPLKVVIFAWRLFRDRLPTKDNLSRRHVIDTDAQPCIGDCGEMETSSHLFLHCDFFGYVWNFILRWLGIYYVMSCDVSSHFIQFSFIGGAAKSKQYILQVIWFATVWKIWKERNNRVFNDKKCSIQQVVDKIKSTTFMWLKGKYANLLFNYHGLWLNSFTILGIG